MEAARRQTTYQFYSFINFTSQVNAVTLLLNCRVLIHCLNCLFRLVGDVLVCTGFLSYSGPFNQEFRTKLLQNWQKEMMQRKIPFTPDLNLTAMLVDNATVSFTGFSPRPQDSKTQS